MQWIKQLTRTSLISVLLATASIASAADQTPAKPQTVAAATPAAVAPTAATAAVAPAGKVNLNSASAAELSTLNGIGAVKAEAIVRFREEHGPFNSVEDLTAVKGIGQATLEKNRSLVVVE
ncbi:ComEA family DNA-binding protein [Parathalassolituus penaei]|uniref:Helix-hairpin-helix domain-containing protein n=1 Tax=Parathalassolituus penaei TaxID=2997323 RepID=A0A9X3EF52_9GAMM|nr:helix-hairpin-helix domain-containing protein [Parathalassolituus penaei]MCY0966389.1 helix-hairpin-helix domain-containing protein [Parathalassolituus penaei]